MTEHSKEPGREARPGTEARGQSGEALKGGREPEDTGPLHARFYRPFLPLVFVGTVAVLLALLRQRMLPVPRGGVLS